MGWGKRLVISGGRYAGSIIGISDNIVTNQLAYIYTNNNLNNSAGEQVTDAKEIFYNTDFQKMIDVSDIFKLDGQEFADECIADIALIKEEEEEIAGYWSLYATRRNGNPTYVEIMGKIKNPSGVVIGTFNGAGSIAIQMSVGENAPTCYLCLAKTIYNDHDLYGLYFNFNQWWTYGAHTYGVRAYAGAFIDDNTIDNTFGIPGHIARNAEDFSPEYGPSSEPGGGYIPGGGLGPSENPGSGTGGIPKIPSFDNTSDKIEVDPAPTLSPLNSKFFNAYVVTEGMLAYISDALFPQPMWNQQDLIGMMGELGQVLFFNKQIDYMLDLLILPIDVPHTDSAHITVGGRELSTVIEGTTYYINGYPVTDVYVDVTCGSLSVEEYWVNFLDFAGTKIKLFLPFIGYVDLQPEYVIGGTVYVDYRFNVIDGSFMCYVRSDSGYSELEESLIGQYAGVAAIHVPLQAQDYSNKISGLISAIGSVAGGAVGGGIGAAAGAGAAASAANTIIQKPGTSHANGYNASSSFLSHRTPYLIIERQWSQFSQKYPEEVGLPANMMCRLGDLSGLVKSSNAHLDVIPCSVEGKEKISQLLADGIIV